MKSNEDALIALTIIAFIVCATIFQENAPLIINKIKELGWLAHLFFLLIYCIATILLLPTMVLTLAGGALFGPVFGTLFNLTGASLGAACAFCISRHFAIDWIAAQNGTKFNKIISGVEKRGWQFAAALRLVPIIPFNLVNYGLGLTRIKFSHYLITTFVFIAPAEVVYTYCGYAGMDALSSPIPLYKNASIIVLLALVILFLLYKLIAYCRQHFEKN